MHVEINAQFEFDVDTDKTLPLAALGEFITEQNIPSRLVEAAVESVDEQLVGRVAKPFRLLPSCDVLNLPAVSNRSSETLSAREHREVLSTTVDGYKV